VGREKDTVNSEHLEHAYYRQRIIPGTLGKPLQKFSPYGCRGGVTRRRRSDLGVRRSKFYLYVCHYPAMSLKAH